MHWCDFKPQINKKISHHNPNHKHENNWLFSYRPHLVLFPNFWLESQCDKYTFPLCCSSKERMHYPDPFCTFQPLHFPLMCTIKTNRCTSQNLFGFRTDAQQTHTHTHIPTQCNHGLSLPTRNTHTHTYPTHTHTYSRRASAVHVKPQVHNHEYLTDCRLHALHICHPPPPPVDGLLSNGNIIIQGDFPCQYWDGI